ncbi:ATP-binding protein [Streptomyces sp. 8N706]|uniref:ATP-binding protein n=1 Tax=Streptomyces sp. 8N706 TaxID=3457416 RepID=UPI003FD54DEC
MEIVHCMSRRAWDLAFLAEPEEVAALRRIIRTHLTQWGLPELVDAVELCVSELVANVITHVGPGTPTTLALSMRGTYVRIEVSDPDARALPTLLNVELHAESGRGMTLIQALTDRWGVTPTASGKTTWCEIGTGLDAEKGGQGVGRRVAKAEALLTLYGRDLPSPPLGVTPLGRAVAEEAAVDLIADLLHWLRAHGRDPDQTLDRAQMHFEADS